MVEVGGSRRWLRSMVAGEVGGRQWGVVVLVVLLDGGACGW